MFAKKKVAAGSDVIRARCDSVLPVHTGRLCWRLTTGYPTQIKNFKAVTE